MQIMLLAVLTLAILTPLRAHNPSLLRSKSCKNVRGRIFSSKFCGRRGRIVSPRFMSPVAVGCRKDDRQVVKEYWLKRTSSEVDEELFRLGIAKNGASDEELLEELIDRFTANVLKYSSQLERRKYAEDSPAFLKWQDYIVSAAASVSSEAPRKPRVNKVSTILGSRAKNRQSSSHLHPSVLGNGMSAEEIQRKVMGESEQRDEPPRHVGFKATGRGAFAQSSLEKADTAVEEKTGRFGRYRDATPQGVKVDNEGWLPNFLMGSSVATAVKPDVATATRVASARVSEINWREKEGFLAQGSLLGCTKEETTDKRPSCVLQLLENDGRPKHFLLDTAKGGVLPQDSETVSRFPSLPQSSGPVLEGGVQLDGVLDAGFLSQYDLDIDFGRKTASLFEPGSLLRHNPSVPGGKQIDLPLSNANKEKGRIVVRARIRTENAVNEKGLFVPGSSEEVVAVVSTKHLRSIIAPWAADKLDTARSSGKGMVAIVEFAVGENTIRTQQEVVRDDIDALEFLQEGGEVPDVILGLDVLAGPSSANRVSISWAQEKIRISIP